MCEPLDEMTRAGRAGVDVAAFDGELDQHRLDALDCRAFAAGHETRAMTGALHAAARSQVDELELPE